MKTSGHILDGKSIANKHLEILSKQIEQIQKKGAALALASVRVGEAGDAILYSRVIERLFKKINIRYTPCVYPETITQSALTQEIVKLNTDPSVTAILVFSPLPKSIHPDSVLHAIDFSKDVEGRRILQGAGERVLSPTAMAAMLLIEETGCEIAGKEAVVIGRSENIGKPCAILLTDKSATVTVCHSQTKNLKNHIQSADIVVATVGKAHLIKGEWVKPGAIVIDVGENVVDGHVVGDVDFETAKERASFISPVPGGVGPLTNVTLIKNLIALHKLKEASHGNR